MYRIALNHFRKEGNSQKFRSSSRTLLLLHLLSIRRRRRTRGLEDFLLQRLDEISKHRLKMLKYT
jgi:hypothetical protein